MSTGSRCIFIPMAAFSCWLDGVRLVGIHPALEVAPQLSSGDKSAAWGAHQGPINQVRHSGQTTLIGRLGCDVICSYRSTEPYMDTYTRGTGICRLFTSFFRPFSPEMMRLNAYEAFLTNIRCIGIGAAAFISTEPAPGPKQIPAAWI